MQVAVESLCLELALILQSHIGGGMFHSLCPVYSAVPNHWVNTSGGGFQRDQQWLSLSR